MKLTAIGLITFSVCIGFAILSGISHADSGQQVKTYVVQPRDTLWSIVTSRPEYQGMDPRDIVYEIELKNHMVNSTVQVGQKIQLP